MPPAPRSQAPGPRWLAGKFCDTLRDGTGCTQGYVCVAEAAGQDGAAVAYAAVVGVGGAARAVAGAPVPGEGGASGFHRGAESTLGSMIEAQAPVPTLSVPFAQLAEQLRDWKKIALED